MESIFLVLAVINVNFNLIFIQSIHKVIYIFPFLFHNFCALFLYDCKNPKNFISSQEYFFPKDH